MRKEFASELYNHMKEDDRIWFIVGDLGYGIFDKIRDDFSDRFINTGAAEQAMMGIACGLAMEGKIPFVYSITSFLLYRPFETIHLYINHEKLNVKLIGSGRDDDYKHDGFSHDASDVFELFRVGIFDHMRVSFPDRKEEIAKIVSKLIESKDPWFLSLRR